MGSLAMLQLWEHPRLTEKNEQIWRRAVMELILYLLFGIAVCLFNIQLMFDLYLLMFALNQVFFLHSYQQSYIKHLTYL